MHWCLLLTPQRWWLIEGLPQRPQCSPAPTSGLQSGLRTPSYPRHAHLQCFKEEGTTATCWDTPSILSLYPPFLSLAFFLSLSLSLCLHKRTTETCWDTPLILSLYPPPTPFLSHLSSKTHAHKHIHTHNEVIAWQASQNNNFCWANFFSTSGTREFPGDIGSRPPPCFHRLPMESRRPERPPRWSSPRHGSTTSPWQRHRNTRVSFCSFFSVIILDRKTVGEIQSKAAETNPLPSEWYVGFFFSYPVYVTMYLYCFNITYTKCVCLHIWIVCILSFS